MLLTDVRDCENETPLHHACGAGHKDIVVYLVEEGKCDTSEQITVCVALAILYQLFVTHCQCTNLNFNTFRRKSCYCNIAETILGTSLLLYSE